MMFIMNQVGTKNDIGGFRVRILILELMAQGGEVCEGMAKKRT